MDFDNTNAYPSVAMPPPGKAWDLAGYSGVAIDVTNPGSEPVVACMRVDSPGNEKDDPWNTSTAKVPAGETRTLQLVFGEDDGSPGFPLDAKNITGAQVFLTKPKKPVSLLLGNLHTIGSAQLNASKDYEVKNFTMPADRDKPASPPAWLGTRPPVDGEWTQTLDQTFKNQKAIDEKIWSFELPWDGLLKGLTMYYTKKEVVLEDGVLKIRIQKRRGHAYDNPALGERDYATGLLITYDKWTQLYGYFEARIKMPTTPGIWPAFWTMPDRGASFSKEWYKRDNTTSGGMEMDVIEYYVNRGPGRYGAGLHWDGYGDKHKAAGSSYLYHPETKDRWHNYGMLWEPGKITFYCDGIKTLEFKSDRVCSVPSYILLNGQTGGYAGPVDDAKLPDAMQVEYVRVWQRKELAEIAKNTVIPPIVSQKPAPAPAPAESGAPGVVPPDSGIIYDPAVAGTDKCIQPSSPQTTFATAADGTTVTIAGGPEPYPGILVKPLGSAAWDLSHLGHVEATVTNLGENILQVVVQAQGEAWKGNPWSTEKFSIRPQETKALVVPLGIYYGAKSPNFNPRSVNAIHFLCAKSDEPRKFRIESIKVAGTPGEQPAAP